MNSRIEEKMIEYYTKYYRDDCCLKDWKKRVDVRLHEEDRDYKEMIDLQQMLSLNFLKQKHCIIGAGTGGLLVALKEKFDCDVYGVEPSAEEFDIIKERCELLGVDKDNFKMEGGENLSFDSNQFDVVHCFTVLEHVQDVDRVISEMIRVVKPGGTVYINTPNYRFPYERHYKIPFPTFLPKVFGYIFLILLGKSPKFLKTINFITEKGINKILIKKDNVVWFRLYKKSKLSKGKLGWLFNFLKLKLFIYPNQEIVIKKLIV